MAVSGTIARWLPKQMVDYMIAAFFDHPKNSEWPENHSSLGRELELKQTIVSIPPRPTNRLFFPCFASMRGRNKVGKGYLQSLSGCLAVAPPKP